MQSNHRHHFIVDNFYCCVISALTNDVETFAAWLDCEWLMEKSHGMFYLGVSLNGCGHLSFQFIALCHCQVSPLSMPLLNDLPLVLAFNVQFSNEQMNGF